MAYPKLDNQSVTFHSAPVREEEAEAADASVDGEGEAGVVDMGAGSVGVQVAVEAGSVVEFGKFSEAEATSGGSVAVEESPGRGDV